MSAQRFCGFAVLGAACCLIASCGPSQSGPKIEKVPVFKVNGVITVDGNPESGVILAAMPLGSNEGKHQARQATSDAEGHFKFSTYESGDGLPEGEYALLVTWPPSRMTMGKKNIPAEEKQAKDRLHGKYITQETSPLKIKIEKGKTLTLDPLDVTTKK